MPAIPTPTAYLLLCFDTSVAPMRMISVEIHDRDAATVTLTRNNPDRMWVEAAHMDGFNWDGAKQKLKHYVLNDTTFAYGHGAVVAMWKAQEDELARIEAERVAFAQRPWLKPANRIELERVIRESLYRISGKQGISAGDVTTDVWNDFMAKLPPLDADPKAKA